MAEQQSNQPGPSSPEGKTTLQERIALEMKKRREAKSGPTSAAASTPASPAPQAAAGGAAPSPSAAAGKAPEETISLQDLIARKRQKLEAELARRQAEEAKAHQEPVQAPAAATATDVPAPVAEVAPASAQAVASEALAAPGVAVAAEQPAAKLATAAPVAAAPKYLNMSGGAVSLQEIISRKKAETQQAQQVPAPMAGAAAPTAAAAPATTITTAPGESAGRRSMMVAAMVVLNTLLLAVVAGLVAFLLRQGHEGSSNTALALALMERSRPAAETKARPAEPNANDYLADLDAPVAALALKDLPSWAQAEQAFAARDFKTALDRYGRLLLASRCVPTETTSGEFFKFRIAESVWSLGRPEAAQKLLNQLTAAESPAVRAAAYAALAEMAEAAGELLQGRALAYRGVAALAAMEGPLPLEADCDYLAARALTRKVNALYTSQPVVPWSRLQRSDPFAGAAEPAIRRLLEEGAAAGRSARAASAGVKIEKAGPRWRLSAAKSTVEDVLNQFAAAAGMNIRWPAGDVGGRRRTVDLQVREMSAQRVVEMVCGMAGLAARFAPDHVAVCDVSAAGTLQEQQAALGREAESAWRRFALRYAGDVRVGEGSFALAALHEWAGDRVSALRQYQFVAKQYASLARISPEALVRSAAIRTELRDYAGAEHDLLDLLDVFPHYPQSADVYIKLGRLKSLVGKHAEALTLFARVLTFELTPESRRETMLAAADCCFQKGDYDAACRWIGDSLAQPAELSQEQIVDACGRLGQYEAARGDHKAAVQAYRRALMANPSRGKYVELVLGVAKSHQAGGDGVNALRMLGRLNGQDMAPQRLVDWLMQLSAAYRAMGLPDRARMAIRKHGGMVADAAMQSRLVLEQARCLWDEGDLVAARQAMTEALAKMGGSEEARAASLELGELCLRMGDAAQAVVVAEDVLRGKCGDEQRRRALELMGRAHMARQEYEKAVRALSAMAEVKMAAADGKKEGHK